MALGQPILFQTWTSGQQVALKPTGWAGAQGPSNSPRNPLKHKSLVVSVAHATTVRQEKLLQVYESAPAYNSLVPFCGASFDRRLRSRRKCHKNLGISSVDHDCGPFCDEDPHQSFGFCRGGVRESRWCFWIRSSPDSLLPNRGYAGPQCPDLNGEILRLRKTRWFRRFRRLSPPPSPTTGLGRTQRWLVSSATWQSVQRG
jgi:hypothetical protein